MQFITVIPGRLVRTYPAEGSKVKPIGSACGGALLMTTPDAEAIKLVQSNTVGFPRRERAAVCVEMMRRVTTFRRQGFATNFGRSVAHVAAVAVPLRNPMTRSPFILSLAGAKAMMTDDVEQIAEILVKAVDRDLQQFSTGRAPALTP
jgi:DNA-binding IclR family transcriptional regulator